MSVAWPPVVRSWSLGACTLLAACASLPRNAPSTLAKPPLTTSSPPPANPAPQAAAKGPADAEPAGPVDSEGFAAALAALRPASAAAELAALEQAPHEATAYARAAIAYAETDAPAMTLIWGMSYHAMGGGSAEPDVARALIDVLKERVTVASNAEGQTEYRVRLAPGQMPVRKYADGTIEAPLAHAFEGLFGTTLMTFHPPWSVEEFYDVLSSWAALVSTRGTPLDEKVELDAWLVGAAKAGHLEAFCYRLLGSAFPSELERFRSTQARALRALDAYLTDTPFRPSRAVMPFDLVRLQ